MIYRVYFMQIHHLLLDTYYDQYIVYSLSINVNRQFNYYLIHIHCSEI